MLRSPVREVDLLRKYEGVKDFIRKETQLAGSRGLVLGLSGGLDSSMALRACVDSLGPGRVLGLLLPEKGLTSEKDMADARLQAEGLGVPVREVDIAPILMSYPFRGGDRVTEGNLKARTRMTVLYYFANSESRLVVGTGDRSEILCGYFTKYGDGGVDLLPLGGLYKTELRVLGGHLGMAASILRKPSSPGLWAGQTAEGEIGLTYETIDRVLVALTEDGLSADQAKAKLSLGKEVDEVAARFEASAHKREMPHICR